MTVSAHYFSPTTPTASSFDVDVSDAIRLGSITGLAGEAQMGSVGTGNVVLDDPGSAIGHIGDGILGLKQFYVDETACPPGNQRMWTGYIWDRRYRRNLEHSLILGADREVDVTLQDLNAFLSFRVFAPVAIDPTSSFVRPAEGTLARIAALLAVDFLSTTLFDIGYVPIAGGVNLNANDYTGSRPIDVLNDIAQVNGWNFWVLYDETGNQLVLWMDRWDTDGTSTLTYDSALRLTNVASEHDGAVTFAIAPDAVEVLDPSRLTSAAYGQGTGVTGYRTRASTANTFAWRDSISPSTFVKDQAKLDALLDRYLLENSTEDPRINCTVRVPAALVTAIHEGMRIEAHFTHLPNVSGGFTWCRILNRIIRQDQETEQFYWLDLELSPIPEVTCSEDSITPYFDEVRYVHESSFESFAVTAPFDTPSVIVALLNVESPYISVGPSVSVDLSGAWNDLGTWGVAPGEYWHDVVCAAYQPYTTGTPESFDGTLAFVEGGTSHLTSWSLMAASVVTPATAPVQTATSVGPTSGNVTLGAPPTVGNILVMFETVRGEPETGPPAGWVQLGVVAHMQGGDEVGGELSYIYLFGTCVTEGMSATITVSTLERLVERHSFVSEWSLV